MAPHRFFLTAPLQGELLPLTDADLHHAVAVARIRRGEQVVAVEPGGRALVVQVTGAERSGLRGVVERELPAERLPDVTVFFGMPKGGKAELIVEKCTEIGVARLVPVLTERAVARPDDERSRAQGRAPAPGGRAPRPRRHSEPRSPRSSRPARCEEVAGRVATFDRFLVAWEDEETAGVARVARWASARTRRSPCSSAPRAV